MCPTLCNPVDYTVHGILQARITGVGSLFLLQGIFPTQGSNPVLPHCQATREAQLKLGKFSRVGLWSNRISVLKKQTLERVAHPLSM